MRKKFLTEKQARYISEDILGFRYSHHDEWVKYDHDTDYQCYFYPGMCPYTFQLNMVTGEVKLDRMSDALNSVFSFEVCEKLRKKFGAENTDFLQETINKHLEIKAKQDSVIEFLNKESIKLIK